MAQDKIASNDWLNVGVSGYAAPEYPCPKCGKESVRHHPIILKDGDREVKKERRICCAPVCRYEGFAPEFMKNKN